MEDLRELLRFTPKESSNVYDAWDIIDSEHSPSDSDTREYMDDEEISKWLIDFVKEKEGRERLKMISPSCDCEQCPRTTPMESGGEKQRRQLLSRVANIFKNYADERFGRPVKLIFEVGYYLPHAIEHLVNLVVLHLYYLHQRYANANVDILISYGKRPYCMSNCATKRYKETFSEEDFIRETDELYELLSILKEAHQLFTGKDWLMMVKLHSWPLLKKIRSNWDIRHNFIEIQKREVEEWKYVRSMERTLTFFQIWNESVPLKLYMKMELCDRSLEDYLYKNKTGRQVDPAFNILVMKQLLSALEYVHKKGMIHRDIKPENIFLKKESDGNEKVLLGDFGISCHLAPSDNPSGDADPPTKMLSKGRGTRIYAAPEQLKSTDYGSSADMYSVGLVLYELYWPMTTIVERSSALKKLREGSDDVSFAKKWPEQWKLIKSLMQSGPSERPSAEEAKKIVAEWNIPSY